MEDTAPVTGCGLCETGMFSYGYASRRGRGWIDGDYEFCKTRIDDARGELVALFGVFDGQGGHRAAEYVQENLFDNMMKHRDIFCCTGLAIHDAYRTTDSELLKDGELYRSRSSCLTAILVKDRLYVANVGNSRAVICRGGKAFAVSRDHTPNLPDELQRIEDAGGSYAVAVADSYGTRSFGARVLKSFVIADPEVEVKKVDDTLEFLILASDGLWDKVTNEEAVSMVVPIQDPEEAAERLVGEAYNRGSLDNITVIIVRFLPEHDEKGPQQNSRLAPASISLLLILCFLCIITFAPLLAILINRIRH